MFYLHLSFGVNIGRVPDFSQNAVLASHHQSTIVLLGHEEESGLLLSLG